MKTKGKRNPFSQPTNGQQPAEFNDVNSDRAAPFAARPNLCLRLK
jgi:hypothetical protein